MSIKFVEFFDEDENNRLELLFVNFDYYDGNDLIAKILHEKHGVKVGEKIDGIWYSIIPLYDENNEYKLVWHEDVGNCIYSEKQDDLSIKRMKELTQEVVDELNRKIKA